ncbi:MAG: phage tail protein [Desulfatitalea sp.]|nr:phage tail protein [Desulfatitalea sp.]NNK00619.1 phage tail protein [Desulfatitalea sp.]
MSTPSDADYPLPAFHFCVTFSEKSDEDAAFKEVSGIGAQIETESYSEGGENRFVYELPKAVKHPKLVLKRGIAENSSPLVQWCKSVLENGLNEAITPKLIHVMLLDADGQAVRQWSFDDAYPVNWEVESFNATKNEVAIEKIELAYGHCQREL